jgi:hypothetical protein
MQPKWTRDVDHFTLTWGGHVWKLGVADKMPGLSCVDPPMGPLLALEGLSETGRRAPHALSGKTLLEVECRAERVVAHYAPLGWGAIHVTAVWAPIRDNGVQLSIEIQARTVGALHGLEVNLLSTLTPAPTRGALRLVEPRDSRAAMLGYDGRERDVASLTTGPPGDPLAPWLARGLGEPRSTYVELAHRDDVSRRIHEGKLPFSTTRYALFGYDLEKGVVLRARLRAYWISKDDAIEHAERLWAEFLAEPLPLTR